MDSKHLAMEIKLLASTITPRLTTPEEALQEAIRAQYIVDDPHHTFDCLSYKAYYGSYGHIIKPTWSTWKKRSEVQICFVRSIFKYKNQTPSIFQCYNYY